METKAFWLIVAIGVGVIIEESRIARNTREFDARVRDCNVRIAKLSEMIEVYKAEK